MSKQNERHTNQREKDVLDIVSFNMTTQEFYDLKAKHFGAGESTATIQMQ